MRRRKRSHERRVGAADPSRPSAAGVSRQLKPRRPTSLEESLGRTGPCFARSMRRGALVAARSARRRSRRKSACLERSARKRVDLRQHYVERRGSRTKRAIPTSPKMRRPLESSMVLSVETTLQHPRRGLIKLEDTVAVMEIGHDVFDDRARGWNSAAAKPPGR